MANPEHVWRLLQKGVDVWNAWRQNRREGNLRGRSAWTWAEPAETPDLSEADLSRANLSGANLSEADLSWTNLQGAILSEADLVGAGLAGAELGGADFSGATLQRANLQRADLSGANLQRANLQRADLSEADLSRATLQSAALSEADLSEASLAGANLSGANLQKANLQKADLAGADLEGADLQEVRLFRANLAEAYFLGARLIGAHFNETSFGNTDLSGATGLDTCIHRGPSNLDHRTLIRSGGLPAVFMRDCGWPDELIALAPVLLQNPLQFYSCFISYSHADEGFAQQLYADLQAKGVRCWYAPDSLKIDDRFQDRMDRTVRQRDKLLVILSKHSMSSKWIEDEIQVAEEKERKEKHRRTILFPIRIDNTIEKSDLEWATWLRQTRHIGDFSNWQDRDAYQAALEGLLRDFCASDSP